MAERKRLRQALRSSTTQVSGRRGRPKGSGSQFVYAELRQRILRLDLAPGVDLDEGSLVREFELSRTPVREALIRLSHDGLVDIVPNRGARVAALNFDEVAEIFEALEIGQRVTSRWAALRRPRHRIESIREFSRDFADAAAREDFDRMAEANRNYHMAIAEAAGNRHLARMLESLLSATVRYAYMTLALGSSIADIFPGGFPEIVAEHEALIAMIEAGDAEGADRLAGRHTRLFRAKVLEILNTGFAADTPVEALDRHRAR
jgi:DNA-binding GntR family transcriptional regulator